MSTRGSFNPLGEVLGIDEVTSTIYTFELTDKGRYKRFNNANPQFLTVPPNSSVAFPVNTVITFEQTGAGSVVVQAGAGVTVNTHEGYMTQGQYAAAQLIKTAINTWTLIGTMTSDVTTTTTTPEGTTTTTTP